MNYTSVAGIILLAAGLLAWSCKQSASGNSDTNMKESNIIAPAAKFNGDTAYSYIKKQLAFGPRVPGSEGNRLCRDFIVNTLKRHGASNVSVQEGEVVTFTKEKFPIANIMASYSPEVKDRVILVAHYDTRPWADSDEREENRLKPIPGANDGASGVAVLLEIARQLNTTKPHIGVDLLFVDAEDYGQSSGFFNQDDSWCLGTQYWVKNMPYASDSLPRYGILLDMVGGMDAKFHREYFSDRYASRIVDKVWSIASRSGYGEQFVNKTGGSVVDDHIFLSEAGIPTIDIIESKNDVTGTFPQTWHTMDDDLKNIDKTSLSAAGQTVLNTIYSEIRCEK